MPDFYKPFALYTDASGKGIGFYLAQKHNGVLKPILFGGRVLSDAERKYAPTDQELLAVFCAVKRCYIYLYGHDFVVYTDHQPLTFLKSFKDIINKRFRWIQYLEEVGVKLVHVPGKENVLADFLSRNIKETPRWSVINSFAVEFKELLYSNDDIREEQHADEHLLSIINKIKFENVKIDIPKEYRHYFHNMTMENEILYFNHHGNRLIIAPQKFCSEIIELSHCSYLSGHFGIYKTHRAVLNRFWWPNCFKDIESYVKECLICQKVKHPRRKEGLMTMKTLPCQPLDLISIDFLVD